MRAVKHETGDLSTIAKMVLVRKRPWGRMISAALVALAVAMVIRAFALGDVEWDYVARYLTARSILTGIVNTAVMSVCAMALGIVLGVIVALMRMSENPVLTVVASGYVWLFRGAPALLQLLLWYNLALIFPTIGIPGVWEVQTVDVMTPFVATLLGLGIAQGAYTSEVVRGGLMAVDSGQFEAAKAIGMPPMAMMRRIVMPQAMRVILPPIGNEFIGMVKLTSLASVIQFSEVLHSAQTIYYANARVIELLIVASIWYLVVVTVLSIGQGFIERRFGRGAQAGRL